MNYNLTSAQCPASSLGWNQKEPLNLRVVHARSDKAGSDSPSSPPPTTYVTMETLCVTLLHTSSAIFNPDTSSVTARVTSTKARGSLAPTTLTIDGETSAARSIGAKSSGLPRVAMAGHRAAGQVPSMLSPLNLHRAHLEQVWNTLSQNWLGSQLACVVHIDRRSPLGPVSPPCAHSPSSNSRSTRLAASRHSIVEAATDQQARVAHLFKRSPAVSELRELELRALGKAS